MERSTKAFLVLFAMIVLTCSSSVYAQESGYRTGIGLRLGLEAGLTVKHFIKEHRAIEGIISRGWGYGGIRITGLYEVHKPFPQAKGLDWYFGFGAHMGFYSGHYYGYYGYAGSGYYDKNGDWHATGYQDFYPAIGIDGILGLEYQFEEIPVTIGVDIKPSFDIIGWGHHYGDGAFSIRYILK